MKQDKFLTGILIGIGVLIVLALALFFTRRGGTDYLADTTPEGVVHNYVVAILDKDYEKAYTYLADLENKPTYEQFRNSFLNGMVNPANTGLEVGPAEIGKDTASVELTIYYSYGDPFSLNTGSKDRATLVKQEGKWKLSYMTYNYWAYDWYQKPYQP
jgi:hypothetical protein